MEHSSINRRQFIRQSLKAAATGYLLSLLPLSTAPCSAADTLFIDSFRPESDRFMDLLERTSKNQADFTDIFVEQVVKRQFTFTNGKLNDSLLQVNEGVAIRALTQDKTAWATADSFHWKPIKKAARKVQQQLDNHHRSDIRLMDLPKHPLRDYGAILSRRKLEQSSEKDVMDSLKAIVSNSPPASNLITHSQMISTDTVRRILVANSQGVFVMDNQPSIDLTFTLTAEANGQKHSVTRSIGHRCGLEFLSNPSILNTFYQASAETVESVTAQSNITGRQALLLAPSAAAAITREWLIKHTSYPKPARYAVPKHLTLTDNGRIQNARATSHYDDEGSPTSPTVLVAEGQTHGFLNRRDHRMRRSRGLTGNGRRHSYLTLPVTAPTNTYMESANPIEEITLADLGTGLMVTQMEPLAANSGMKESHFHIVSGWQITNGQRTRPISNLKVTLPFPGLLDRIQLMGSDLLYFSGSFGQLDIPVSFGAPSMLLTDVQISAMES